MERVNAGQRSRQLAAEQVLITAQVMLSAPNQKRSEFIVGWMAAEAAFR